MISNLSFESKRNTPNFFIGSKVANSLEENENIDKSISLTETSESVSMSSNSSYGSDNCEDELVPVLRKS